MSLRDLILSAADRPLSPVEVPEWGCTVYVRVLSAGEAYNMKKKASTDEGGATVSLVMLAACDADGNRLFTEADLEAIAAKNWEPIERVATAALMANSMSPGAIDAAKKDSAPTPS